MGVVFPLARGVKAHGVEHEEAHATQANACAKNLGLDSTVVQADAREVDYRGGNVFYLYNPFRGQLLEEFFQQLKKTALPYEGDRPFVVAGKFTLPESAQSWLEEDTEASGALQERSSFNDLLSQMKVYRLREDAA